MKIPRSSLRIGAGLGAVAALLGACAVGPDFVPPAPPTVGRYTLEPVPMSTVAAAGRTQDFAAGSPLVADWWRLFECPQMDALVLRAIAGNPTLQASEASLRQSRENLLAGEGVFYPRLDAAAAAAREHTAPLQQGVQTPGTTFTLLTLSGTVGYALDVFGGERRTAEGLRAQYDYEGYENLAAYLTLSASVVDAAIARAGYAAEIRATRQLLDLERQQLQLSTAQVSAGTAPYSSLLGVQGLIAANQALLAPLEQRESEAGDLLASLEGATPAEAALPDIDLAALALPAELPLSLPSDLVRRRPDILSAEAQLHLASANIGVATAAMFPSISLSGTYGGASSSFGGLSAGGARFWSIGPSATIPLFQGGGLWHGRRAAVDAFQGAQAAYRQTVLAAFAQVADSLNALDHDAQGLKAQDDARLSAGETLRLLQANYTAGLVAYPDVLAADVQLHQAEIAWLQAVAQRHQDTVALFVALGGGWWSLASPQGTERAP